MEDQKRTTPQELLDEIAQVVAENFVAIYEKDGQDLIVRSVGGEKFRLTIQAEQ